MNRSYKHELGVGLLVGLAAVALAYMSVKMGGLTGMGETITVHVQLDDAAGLSAGALAKVAGVDVGRIERLTVEHDRAELEVELTVAAALREDALVQVRARSVLGEKFLDFQPQSMDAALLKDGAVITRSRDQTEIDELVNTMGPLLESIDPEAWQAAFAPLIAALEEDPERAKRMLLDMETALHNVSVASAQLPGLMEEASDTLQSVRESSDAMRPVIDDMDALVVQLQAAADPLPETVAEFDSLVGATKDAVDKGDAFLSKLDENGDSLIKIIENLSEFDKMELRRLLREEGILVRMREAEVKRSSDD